MDIVMSTTRTFFYSPQRYHNFRIEITINEDGPIEDLWQTWDEWESEVVYDYLTSTPHRIARDFLEVILHDDRYADHIVSVAVRPSDSASQGYNTLATAKPST